MILKLELNIEQFKISHNIIVPKKRQTKLVRSWYFNREYRGWILSIISSTIFDIALNVFSKQKLFAHVHLSFAANVQLNFKQLV